MCTIGCRASTRPRGGSRAGARGPRGHRTRPDERAAAGTGHDRLLGRRADVLVCTTIIEAGLDISSANTLLIERSDLLGLSQLHQLRGRVGRGRERGYAYFLYPPDRSLSEAAYDRIGHDRRTQRAGSGMAIAMKDLEISGAGDLLAASSPVTSPTSASISIFGW